ncbi:STAS domain-containing protein [Streptomyces sp. NPDC002057]|uniref:STAS domain-containing protein n=1 Tax=Streptomyces sp. NPDC002057 TaxID=3154664 RepID=UPI003324EAC0
MIDALPSVHDSGADTAPGVILVRSCTTLGPTLVVHVAGEVDRFSSAPLRALLASAAADGYTGLVLDTSLVTFCDSGLLAAVAWWPRKGRRLRLVNSSRAVRHLLAAAASGSRRASRRGAPTATTAAAGPGRAALPPRLVGSPA